MKLLLIEDDKPSLKALNATLKILGFDCEAFSDPLEAMARFRSGSDFDVVITDLRMPRKSGIEISREIRNFKPLTQIIVITAYKDHPQLNADRVFYKPVDIQALVEYLKFLSGDQKTPTKVDSCNGE